MHRPHRGDQPEVILFDEPASALDPISTAKIEGIDRRIVRRLHDRDRHPQHAAGGAGLAIHRLHVSGQMVEFDETNTVHFAPRDKRTQDYVTGRFG